VLQIELNAMALKLHGDLFSNNTKRVAVALEELEVI
jgi:hypothetical protein